MLVDADDRLKTIDKYLSNDNGLIGGNGYTTTTTA
jgi:hypothetical protein